MPQTAEYLTCELLGLHHWQKLPEDERLYSHIGWFDRRGFTVGCGDVSPSDLMQVSDRLPGGELLVLGLPMGEEGCQALATLFERGKFVIVAPKRKFHWVVLNKDTYVPEFDDQGLRMTVISVDEARRLLDG
jgi:hypothetical protein